MRPWTWPFSILLKILFRFSKGSKAILVFINPLAPNSRVSMASCRVPTALPTILNCFGIKNPGIAVAIGTDSPSGIPTQTRVPFAFKKPNAWAYAALLAVQTTTAAAPVPFFVAANTSFVSCVDPSSSLLYFVRSRKVSAPHLLERSFLSPTSIPYGI